MTLAIKDSNGPGSAVNTDSKASQSPRSNPVCLEVGVTIRSLPTETNGLSQPTREEVRTVIVFDNGAVLRCASNMPAGQTVILSNAQGRDVVCKVAGGHNLPSVKGYVEVEFIEPVSDFWHLHQDVSSAAPTQPAPVSAASQTPTLKQELPPVPSAAPPPAAAPPQPAKPARPRSGSGPSFEDIAGVVSMSPPSPRRTPRIEPAKAPSTRTTEHAALASAETSKPTSPAAFYSSIGELPKERPSVSVTKEASPGALRVTALPTSFTAGGLMSSLEPRDSFSASGRTPLVLAGIVLVLAGAGGGWYYTHRSSALPTAAPAVPIARQTAAPQPAVASVPETQAAPQTVNAQVPAPVQPAAAEQVQPVAAVASIPAAVASAAATGARAVQRQDIASSASKQPQTAPPRRPALSSLKMSSPSSPVKRLASSAEESAPPTEIASPETVSGASPVSLLSAGGRASSPPAAPVALPSASAPAPAPASAPATGAKTMLDAKLISSTRPVYPAAARESNIQGNVAVSASIDERGSVTAVKALSGPMFLRQAAMDSVKQWKYSPATLDGKPISSQVTVNVEFRLK